jgi:hypothetical protein
MEPAVQKYLSTIGRRGGKKSKRSLSPGAARDMVRVREARRAYRQFHAQCFWSFDPNYRITSGDVPWVAERLRTHGGPLGYQLGVRLCR